MTTALKVVLLKRDHPFKTSEFFRGGVVKNWSNLQTDSSKKRPTRREEGSKSQQLQTLEAAFLVRLA